MAGTSSTVEPPLEGKGAPADPNLIRIRDLIYRLCGIYMPDNKYYFLGDRCGRRMKVVGASSFSDYLDQLTLGSNRDAELRALLNEITVGETCFFRNQPQLDAVMKIILPKMLESKRKSGYRRLRVWSSGCSTGEEPYTLAMLLMEASQSLLVGWQFEIQATDLNDHSLARCKEGLYSDYALRNSPEFYRQKYFTPEGDQFRIRDEVKARVEFQRLNLRDDTRMVFMKGLDLIFCCNVLIYFDGAAKRRTVQHYFNALLPGGYFFLGHSESLYGVNDQFRLVHFPKATAYWKPVPDAPAGGAK